MRAQRGVRTTGARSRPIVTEESRSVRSLLLIFECAAPTAEMNEKDFGLIKKWGGHDHPSHCGSDALVLHVYYTYHPQFTDLSCIFWAKEVLECGRKFMEHLQSLLAV